MPTPISMYQPIWDALKRDAVCKITAPKALHRRIIKAISKRKNEDVAYKYMMGELGKRATLKYVIENSVITFTLVKTIGVDDL